MWRHPTKAVQQAFRRIGIDVRRVRPDDARFPDEDLRYPFDFDGWVCAIAEQVKPFTMTGPLRVNALCKAVEYVTNRELPGAIVECGVWRGGSMMAAALTLIRGSDSLRDLYLFDTFEGMPAPTADDVDIFGRTAAEILEEDPARQSLVAAVAGLEEVQKNMAATGYPSNLVHFVPGLVENTIPAQAPDRIALLRLDTDWYSSTRHELEHLVPRLVPGGVLIIDDYGYWGGCRQAVDEFFAQRPVLLSRVDGTGRMAVL